MTTVDDIGGRQRPVVPVPWVVPLDRHWPASLGALTTTRFPPPDASSAGPDAGRFGWNLADHVDDAPGAVAAARRELQTRTGVTAIQWLTQVHGSHCIEATPDTLVSAPEADAAWTCRPGLAVAVLTADCVPVVLGDRTGSVAAVAHGGWRGLVGGVLERLVDQIPVPASDLVAWLGPAIGPAAYQVGADVVEQIAGMADGGELLGRVLRDDPAPDRYRLDLFTLATDLLVRAGAGRVSTEALCTFEDERFFSFRRDRRTGRMATLAWRR